MAAGIIAAWIRKDEFDWRSNAASLPAPKATVGVRTVAVSGSITAAGLISPSRVGVVGPGYGYPGNSYDSGPSAVMSCSSDDMRRHYCPADTRGGVQLLKQRSDSSCRQGYSWGYDRRGIWVDHGCRADFQVGR